LTDAADLGVRDAAAALRRRELSAVELTEACLRRIRERDGTHSFDGDPSSVNAWVRVYEEDALAAAADADRLLAEADPPPLAGVPIGLKDLYAVAGKPLTASSRLLDEVPEQDCVVWTRLRGAGMVLLGHLHTHEFAAGGTTDQVGNPWALDRSAGGSSGGSGAALAARMVPAATGTDTAGSLRIPSAFCGTSTIKPTRDLVPIDGIVPLAPTLDHSGPMARTVGDCAWLLALMAGLDGRVPAASFDGLTIGVSSRVDGVELDADVAAGFEAAIDACRRLGARIVSTPPAPDTLPGWGEVLLADMRPYHLCFDDHRELYRPSIREFAEGAANQVLAPGAYDVLQARRGEDAERWERWFSDEHVAAVLEPTVPDVAWPRGPGYDRAGSDVALITLTHHWDWTGHPVVALPAGLGARSGLPVSVSLIGPLGRDSELLALGEALQGELGVPEPDTWT
jgi:aspartyl-tRNA(Asn)/glutamyl-tRNA(Gln) amidotransferase subunit A